MKKAMAFFVAAAITAVLFGCSVRGADRAAKPVKIKALIIPKFEIGEMSGDGIGETCLRPFHGGGPFRSGL